MSGSRASGKQATGLARPLNLLGVTVVVLAIAAVGVWRFGQQAAPGQTDQPSRQATDEATPSPTEPVPTDTPADSPAATPDVTVETHIVDRPGVPNSLYAKYWSGGGQVGQVGTTARMVLPEDEELLGVDAGRVATFAIDPNTSRPIFGTDGVQIIVRDIETGATLRKVSTNVSVATGLLTGSTLMWMGKTDPTDGSEPIDGGVWAIDLSVADSTPVQVIAASNLAEKYGSGAVRGFVRLTDQGRSAVSLIQSSTDRATDIIDVASLSLRQTLDNAYAYEVAGNAALVIPLHGDSGQDAGRMRLIDLASGADIGPGVKTDEVAWAYTGEREIYVQYAAGGTGYSITAIDGQTGDAHALIQDVSLHLSNEVSAPDELVLIPAFWEVGPDGAVHQPFTLVDPSTGEVTPDAFVVGSN